MKLRPNLLAYSARTGNVPLVRLTLSLGASPNTLVSEVPFDDALESLAGMPLHNVNRQPVVMAAAWNKHPRMVKMLLEAGANANISDKAGITPLWAAVLKNDRDSVRLLLRHGADANPKHKDNSKLLDGLPDHTDLQIVVMLNTAVGKSSPHSRHTILAVPPPH